MHVLGSPGSHWKPETKHPSSVPPAHCWSLNTPVFGSTCTLLVTEHTCLQFHLHMLVTDVCVCVCVCVCVQTGQGYLSVVWLTRPGHHRCCSTGRAPCHTPTLYGSTTLSTGNIIHDNTVWQHNPISKQHCARQHYMLAL